jgi:dipeptidyl aminopeptidase/acylaminoacyl peptidase
MACPPGRVDELSWDDSGKVFVYAHTPEGTDRWDVRLGTPEGGDTLLYGAPGTWLPMDLSPDRKFLILQKYVSASESELHVLDIVRGSVTRVLPNETPQSFQDAKWADAKAGSMYFTSDRGDGVTRLYRLPWGGEPKGPVQESYNDRWDIEWFALSQNKRTLVYSVNEEGLSRLYRLAPTLGMGKLLVKNIRGIPKGLIESARFRPGSQEFAFTLNSAAFPGDVFTYDLKDHGLFTMFKPRLRRWTRSETGGLPAESFREPRLIHYPTFDSVPVGHGDKLARRTIPAWVYLPSAGKQPYPVLVQVHGGPEQQARPGFDAFVQYALSRGIAVIAPNVRGSSGYGRDFLDADNGRLRMHSVRDVGALLDWIGTRRDLDSTRVAVAGRSYGGFMALASLVEYGGRLKAGASTVGITHFPTFLKNTSGYRRDLRRVEYGDERDSSMAVFLDSISPLTNLSRIRSPLLLCHGRNDPRVPYSESEHIFSALKSRSVPVWFLSFRDEGHAFRDEASRSAYFRVMGSFLTRYLKP